jgi:hypothetical protein
VCPFVSFISEITVRMQINFYLNVSIQDFGIFLKSVRLWGNVWFTWQFMKTEMYTWKFDIIRFVQLFLQSVSHVEQKRN